MNDRRNVLPISLPPRGLSRVESAAYIGVSPSLFDTMVADGRMPKPKQVNAQPEVGLVDRNPARDVKYITSTGDGFHTWTVEEVRKFEEKYPIGTRERLALALMAFTGVRRSDVVQLGRQMVRDGWLYFRETKGQARKIKDRTGPCRSCPNCSGLSTARRSGT